MAQYKNGYTNSEIVSMQKDAMRRVNEMQRIAKQKIESTSASPPPNLPSQLHQPTMDERPPTQATHEPQTPLTPQKSSVPNPSHNPPPAVPHVATEVVSSTFAGILDKLNLDDEKLLLILLIIILINEGADLMLILALGYILL